MRVLHLSKTSEGAAWAYRLMRELVSYGEEVHVALPLGGSVIPLYRQSGIIIHEIDFSFSHPLKTIKKLREIVKKVQPDIVHSHFVQTTLFMRIALRDIDIPRIYEVAGPLHLEHSIFRNVEILSAQHNDYWIPTCQWSYDRYVRSGVSKDRLFLTYYGGDFVKQSYSSGKLRKELGLSEDDIVVGMVAYMYAPKKFLGEKRGLKGHEDFIDAISVLEKKYPNLYSVCIGGCWANATYYEQQVISYGKEKCKRLTFLGTRKNIPELYQDIDIVVHPSHSENLGGAAESLVLGVPTIATSVGGFPDIVIDHKTGLLVPPNNPLAIVNAVDEMIQKPEDAKRMAREGQMLVEDKLNAKITSKEVYGFYHEILKEKVQ